MCKSKMAIEASEPSPSPRSHLCRTPTRASKPSSSSSSASFSQSLSDPSSSRASSANYTSTSGNNHRFSSGTSASSRTSLSSLRDTLPENPLIYDVSEISAATNNFLAKKHSPSSASWRCTLRGKDVIVFQRKFRRKLETHQLRERLSVICRSHHMSIIKLLGASVSGDHLYLVYEFVTGANLADCLRNSRNPNFTVLSNWISRMQIATDLAHGLDYIHNNTGQSIKFVHNHLSSSSVIVTEPSFNAKICHFGTAQLCGEADQNEKGEIEVARVSKNSPESKSLRRSNSGTMQFEGVRGYMSPEFQSSGVATQKSDVYAFGVVILELLSGEEALKYRFDKAKCDFVRTSVIDTASEAINGGDGDGVSGRLRKWVDGRLRDSFPVDVAEKVTRLALECVHVDPDQRPNMRRVAGKISKLYLESRIWSDNLKVPTGISVSLAPR